MTSQSPAITEKVLVLHVKQGYEERARHIEKMLAELHIPFEYILDGDINDITPEVLDKYFKDGKENMHGNTAKTSCCYKHFLAYEYILKNNLKGVLILEDDCILDKKFPQVFNLCMKEFEKMPTKNILISFEDSRLRFIPRSQRIKGQYLYKGDKDRMTGAYYISRGAAEEIMNYVAKNKCERPIDLLHSLLIKEENFPYYWCQPTVASQGSFTGKFHSSISSKKEFCIWASWRFKLTYKRLLYFLR